MLLAERFFFTVNGVSLAYCINNKTYGCKSVYYRTHSKTISRDHHVQYKQEGIGGRMSCVKNFARMTSGCLSQGIVHYLPNWKGEHNCRQTGYLIPFQPQGPHLNSLTPDKVDLLQRPGVSESWKESTKRIYKCKLNTFFWCSTNRTSQFPLNVFKKTLFD